MALHRAAVAFRRIRCLPIEDMLEMGISTGDIANPCYWLLNSCNAHPKACGVVIRRNETSRLLATSWKPWSHLIILCTCCLMQSLNTTSPRYDLIHASVNFSVYSPILNLTWFSSTLIFPFTFKQARKLSASSTRQHRWRLAAEVCRRSGDRNIASEQEDHDRRFRRWAFHHWRVFLLLYAICSGTWSWCFHRQLCFFKTSYTC